MRLENRVETADAHPDSGDVQLGVAKPAVRVLHGQRRKRLEQDLASFVRCAVGVDEVERHVVRVVVGAGVLQDLPPFRTVAAQNAGLGSMAITCQPAAR